MVPRGGWLVNHLDDDVAYQNDGGAELAPDERQSECFPNLIQEAFVLGFSELLNRLCITFFLIHDYSP